MVILQILALTAHYSENLSFGWSTHPIKWQFHRFLLYSESSSFGRPGPDRSTTLIKGNFTDSCSTLRAHHLADQVLADLPTHQMEISQIPALTAHYFKSSTFYRPGLGRSTTLIKGNFTDSCSTLRAHHLADQVLTDLPPIQWWFYRFLLWQPTTLRTYHLADQVLADLPTHQMAISQIPAVTAPYSKSSTFDRPGLGRSDPPHQMAISQIPVKFIFHSYSESLSFGRPGLGRSTPI